MNTHIEGDGAPYDVEYTVDGSTPAVVYRTIARNLEDLDAVDVIGRREPVQRSGDSNPRDGELLVVWSGGSVGTWPLEYKPRGPHGTLAMLLGAVFALPSFFLTLLLVGVGYVLYRVDREGSVPLLARTRVRVTVEGTELAVEGAESAKMPADKSDDIQGIEPPEGIGQDDPAASTTSSTGPVTVTATCSTGPVVNEGSLADLEWPLRRVVVARVREASNQIPSPGGSESVEKTFFQYLSAWRTRSPRADVELVESVQAGCLQDEETWRAYTDALLDWSARPVGNRLDERQLEIRSDLEGVFENVEDDLP